MREAEWLAAVQDFAEVVAAHRNQQHGAGLLPEQAGELAEQLFRFRRGQRSQHHAELHRPQAVILADLVQLVANFVLFDIVNDEERGFVFGNDDGHVTCKFILIA